MEKFLGVQVKLKLVSANGAPMSVFWGGKNSFCSPPPFSPHLFAWRQRLCLGLQGRRAGDGGVKVAVEVAKANQEAASTTHFQVRDFRAGLGPL